MSSKSTFTFKSKKIPTVPGCYLFYDKTGKLLYVGKAKHLRKRVSSYFQKTKKSIKTNLLIKKIKKIETREVHSEMEALILENNLIKEFRPRFNILLRDDKNFLYLRITNELFPRIEITRKVIRDGSFYVGPKTSAKSFRQMINFCQKIFQIRDCKLEMEISSNADINKTVVKIVKNPENRKIPCLDFHVKKCAGPCSQEISVEDYKKNTESMKRFLRGKTDVILKQLTEKMMKFAADKNFEAAKKIRDLIQSIEVSTQKQTVQFLKTFDADFINFYREKNSAFFVRIVFRNGKLLDQNEVEFQAPESAENSELLEKFLLQFYERVDAVPDEIYIPEKINANEEIESFLFSQKSTGNKTQIIVPQKGDKKKILEIAQKNAKNFGKKESIEQMSKAENFSKALPNLAKILNLKKPPKRIECFDVSHFSGEFPVASQIVFVNGKPKKSEYRRFHVKSLPEGKVDDFAAMNEVLERRFLQLNTVKIKKPKKQKKKKTKKEEKEAPQKSVFEDKVPDLIVLDGGKGQLSAVMKLFKEKKIKMPKEWVPKKRILSLAKKEELIFRPGIKEPLELDFNEPALKLLQRVRDEAHRFAISFNRNLRKKQQQKSLLDEVSGIGPATKKKLIKRFETVSGIQKAKDNELLEILNAKQLENLRKIL